MKTRDLIVWAGIGLVAWHLFMKRPKAEPEPGTEPGRAYGDEPPDDGQNWVPHPEGGWEAIATTEGETKRLHVEEPGLAYEEDAAEEEPAEEEPAEGSWIESEF